MAYPVPGTGISTVSTSPTILRQASHSTNEETEAHKLKNWPKVTELLHGKTILNRVLRGHFYFP